MGHHQRRFLDLLDDGGHGEGFPGAGGAQEHLVAPAEVDAFHQFVNGLGLVAHGLIRGVKFKWSIVHAENYRTKRKFV